jgi:5-methyltetrahydropteroyltriglutamate--homocysteine methyltransferase
LIQSCDVGSLPYTGKLEKLVEGANHYTTGLSDDLAKLFEQTIVNAFLDKLEAGIEVPAFPQFRDMNEMFLSTFKGIEKIKEGYIETGRLNLKLKHGKLPEVTAIERNAPRIHTQKGPFQLRICVTGPYTLASFFPYRTSQTYTCLGQVLSEIIEKNIFAAKHGKVSLIAVDEPLFGMIDDPSIDKGTEGRENLLSAWGLLASKAKSKKVETCIHLHCTSDDLFWSVKSLGIVESHVGDPLYEMQITKQRLEKKDKFLKASVAITDFDRQMQLNLVFPLSDDQSQ